MMVDLCSVKGIIVIGADRVCYKLQIVLLIIQVSPRSVRTNEQKNEGTNERMTEDEMLWELQGEQLGLFLSAAKTSTCAFNHHTIYLLRFLFLKITCFLSLATSHRLKMFFWMEGGDL